MTVFAPVIKGRKGEHRAVLDRLRRDGYIVLRSDNRSRIAEALELAIKEGEGVCSVLFEPSKKASQPDAAEGADGRILREESHEAVYSTKFSCPEHGVGIEEMEPRMFSFNAPYGACEHCSGLGFTLRITDEAVITDENKSILNGALGNVFSTLDAMGFYRQMLNRLAADHGTNLAVPYKRLPEKFRDELLHGTGTRRLKYTYESRSGRISHMNHTFEGIIPSLERRWGETNSEYIKEKISEMMTEDECPVCKGRKLRDTVLAVTVGGKNIMEITDLSVVQAMDFFDSLDSELSKRDRKISAMITKEIKARLKFLKDVGLGYLTLSRTSATLSGGESQRIRLATQIGSGLVGVLYILDEPSIGLHQADNSKLLGPHGHGQHAHNSRAR